eukprot:c40072_g1_i1 orf=61-252(-)
MKTCKCCPQVKTTNMIAHSFQATNHVESVLGGRSVILALMSSTTHFKDGAEIHLYNMSNASLT